MVDEQLGRGQLSPGEEQIVPFSASVPVEAKPGECEDVLMELQVMRDDFFVPVDGFTFRTCVVAPTTLTCLAPQTNVEIGDAVNISGNLSPAKGGEIIAIEYTNPGGSKQVINKKVTGSGLYRDSFIADEAGKWQMQAYWQGSDTSAAAESGVCTFDVINSTPGLNLISNANCRKGPGTAYEIVTSAPKGMLVPISARSEDGEWLYGKVYGAYCWISENLGEFNGNVTDLPVRKPPLHTPPPTFLPSLTPAVNCSVYTTQTRCNRFTDSCKWVVQPTGSGICIAK